MIILYPVFLLSIAYYDHKSNTQLGMIDARRYICNSIGMQNCAIDLLMQTIYLSASDQC